MPLSLTPAPGGMVAFLDTSASNKELASASLVATSHSLFFRPPKKTYGIGSLGVAIGDFSGDGKPGLVMMNDDGTKSVLLGNGDGSFKAQQASPGGYLSSRVLGDLNGDGKLDLASKHSRRMPPVTFLSG